ncbi:hypothetical protein QN277_008978 [Acacia crassicarpa]|uniref:PGG domain-containing protein n=1 Tax=Acacia crassicarpa TaxID=499986 RepID=A0AAE1IS28_9FABA|nr:hypothetical protein QN277_008978 [Acacia crassicarpa]
MSTSRGDLEQYSLIDLDPLEGLHRPPPCQGGTAARPKSGEQLGEIEQSSESANQESGEIEQSSESSHEESGEIEQSSESSHEESGWKEDLCRVICANSWSDTKAILDQHPNALTAVILNPGRTAIHVAAQFGNITIVKELLQLLPREFLLTVDSYGLTALALACWYNGNTQIAKCLVNKNSDIVSIPTKDDFLPVTRAFENDFKEMGRYLYSATPLECFTGRLGSQLLRYCFQAQCFDIALNLLQQREGLLLVPYDIEGKYTPIHEIATLNTVILSPSKLIFWKRWIYDYINIPSTTAINHVSVDIQQERSQGDQAKLIEPGHGLLLRFIPSVDNFVGVKKIQELKLLHIQVDDLLLLVCKNAGKAFNEGTAIEEALQLAAKEGNVEFVVQVTKVIPDILVRRFIGFCFIEALNYRQARVFNLIHGLRFKNGLMTSVNDDDYNTLLHKAAMKAPDHVLNHIYGPTLQMQRELQWFKEVEGLMPPSLRGVRDKNGLTPKELFRESHRELMKEGEKWIKETASSCSVVGTLIVTIMFAAAFTIPGGNDQNLGYPLFIKQPFFMVFIFSTIISFLSSSTSVLMFLAVLSSHYSEEKFLKSLPTKLILGLSFLFMSIVSMITAFISATYLMLHHTNYSWGLLPIMILASVPIFLFVVSQFPLLLHTYVSTYGDLFDKNVKPWP